MESDFSQIHAELKRAGNSDKLSTFNYFFKGDRKFYGVTVPQQREIVKRMGPISFSDIEKLLGDDYHEARLIGLLFLVAEMSKNKDPLRAQEIFDFYVSLFPYINDWDFVDLSAPAIVGKHLLDKDRSCLYCWAHDPNFWVQRIAIVSTWFFIKNKQIDDTFALAHELCMSKEDLIQKATGWMLREAGKKDFDRLYHFLRDDSLYQRLPRTLLRYAIEKFPEELRQDFLKGRV